MTAKELELLFDLGLTASEAKVYLTLIKYGPSSAEKVAETSKIARERVYILMPLLRKKGLVEEIISSPKKFEAVPINVGLNLLLTSEREKMKSHEAIAQQILENKSEALYSHKDDFKISLFPRGQIVPIAITKASENAEESIDLIVKQKNLVYQFEHFGNEDFYKKIVQKGVILRIITDVPIKSTILLDSLKGTHLRSIQEIGLGVAIIDNRKIFMRLSNEPKWDESQMLFLENEKIANIFSKYFENMWLNSTPF